MASEGMTRDHERIARIKRALDTRGLDVLVCGLRANVLLLSGYWPVIGSALAVATRDGSVGLIVPADEVELASAAGPIPSIRLMSAPWRSWRRSSRPSRARSRPSKSGLGIGHTATIGFEGGAAFDPSGYASTYGYGAAVEHLLHDVFLAPDLCDATDCLADLQSVLTDCELRRLRTACAIAQLAYQNTAAAIRIGMTELDIAEHLRAGLASAAA